ncbi:MAG TPA: galactose-1-phosphate uridylyltransferase [Syntrophorhabdaceae bacterium]|nr:galactose-1-phosphate uridylyltransferase [Syntrophorhabdaceae bacterium]HOL04689.1 galactose-1-phosphate uridylyltransferase [Syntrophorhabdaceae bacterium]HON85242.1 galactose-1-phosphate uridylyltransferase [Syntrophorhabdaceae bacterium]HOT43002.1 galactose-1-phosphate uridylyltransferase [Syntrophorhabdaceae bacterium]HPC66123.1 galactose-1-phosphate uridylyltransferase [Syntrophorhabdaceae bacterium]
MPEIRLNTITGDWVIIATERAKRPEDFSCQKEKRELPSYSERCPFCPGNESMTPDETFRIAKNGMWSVRSVPNKFSALSPVGNIEKSKDDFKYAISGVGLHEVIIETPQHNMTTALLPVEQVYDILLTYQNRMLAFYSDPRIEHVIIFKNHGVGAGTSLEHPHSQIVGIPVFPGQVMGRLGEAIRNYYYVNFGECLYCTYLKGELRDGSRIVAENDSFVAFVPYAALSPFHLWIFPRKHDACFASIDEKQLLDLSYILKDILLRLYKGLDNPDFNYMIRSLSPRGADSKYFHWYIAIVPRVSQAAGFELGTGMFINTALPEESARFLREAI